MLRTWLPLLENRPRWKATVREVLLGDNPFFCIDHMSQERARAKKHASDFKSVAEVMEYASGRGVGKFVVSTHPELRQLVMYMKNSTDLLEKLEFCPIFPYAQGYVEKVTEKGAIGAVRDILSGAGTKARIRAALGASAGYLKGDASKMLRSLIDVELDALRYTKCKTAFLHDIVTDLCLGLGLDGVIRTYVDHVRDSHGLSAGVVTKNFPLLTKRAESWGMGDFSVMTSFNSIGFQMNPSREACESALGLRGSKCVVAMNALAGGFLRPADAAKYVSDLGIQAVAVGMSTVDHARETIDAFQAA